jgi:hypothetical protein
VRTAQHNSGTPAGRKADEIQWRARGTINPARSVSNTSRRLLRRWQVKNIHFQCGEHGTTFYITPTLCVYRAKCLNTDCDCIALVISIRWMFWTGCLAIEQK